MQVRSGVEEWRGRTACVPVLSDAGLCRGDKWPSGSQDLSHVCLIWITTQSTPRYRQTLLQALTAPYIYILYHYTPLSAILPLTNTWGRNCNSPLYLTLSTCCLIRDLTSSQAYSSNITVIRNNFMSRTHDCYTLSTPVDSLIDLTFSFPWLPFAIGKSFL